MRPTAASRSPRIALVTVTVLLAAVMLRAPIVAVAPVASELARDLGVTAAGIGVLTTIPVLCFAVVAPAAVALAQRLGAEASLTLCLAGAVAGCVVRSLDGYATALIGTATIGVFVTIGNVVVPAIIARDYSPRRAPMMTGVYTAALNVGTMTVTIATAPLAGELGWRAAIAVWAFAGVVAIAVWVGAHGPRAALLPAPRPIDAPTATQEERVLRNPATLMVALAFAGQSFSYYGISAWLPTLLRDAGYHVDVAGGMASLFQVFGLVAALAVPLIVPRLRIPPTFFVVGLCWLAAPLGFAFAPHLWWLWGALGGLGQGGGFTIVFIAIVAAGGGARVTTARSGAVQGVGYAIGAFGSVVVGSVHDATGAWAPAMGAVVIAVVAFCGFGFAGSRMLSRRSAAAT